MLQFQTPAKAKSYRPASGKLLPDLGARNMQVKITDWSLRYVNPRVADTHRALMAVLEMNDMGHDVCFPRSDRGIKAYAYHDGSGTKLELERANGVFLFHTDRELRRTALQVRILHFWTDRGCDCRPPTLTRTCSAVSVTKEALLEPLVVGGSSGSRDEIYPIPGGGLLGERFVVPGGRAVVKAKKAPLVTSLDEWDGHLEAGHMPSIEDGVHSALLAKERVKLTDGSKHHVIIGIRNFIWKTPTWAEKQRTEHSASSNMIMSGVQTLLVKSVRRCRSLM